MREMWDSVSDTAEFGGLTRGADIIDDDVRANMGEVLEDIQQGTFAREWIQENQTGRPQYHQLRQEKKNHEIENVGEELRSLFAWAEEGGEVEQEESEESQDRVNLKE